MSIMTRLKTETKVYHTALETTPNSQALMSPQVSLQTYQQSLKKFYGFHAPIERHLAALLPDWEARRKVPALLADFAILGQDINTIPECPSLPLLDTPSKQWGYLYVVEGASLGGQIITRHLRQHLPLQEFHYFGSYGEEVGLMWRSFSGQLSAYAHNPALEDEVIAGAVETFSKLKVWLLAK